MLNALRNPTDLTETVATATAVLRKYNSADLRICSQLLSVQYEFKNTLKRGGGRDDGTALLFLLCQEKSIPVNTDLHAQN
jgi:hypothetical protein